MSWGLKSCTSGPAASALVWVPLAWASLVALEVKNLPASTGDLRHRFDPWVGKIPWRRK